MTQRKKLTVAGVSLAAAIAGVGLTAGALPAVADASTSSEATTDRGAHEANGVTEEELTGDTADQVEAAVVGQYPGATIDRVETDAEGAAYEAHITQADGTRATVKLDASFAITATETGGGRGGAHDDEDELTGDTADQVEATVLAEYPDATIDRLESDSDGAAYEAHITRADGTRATVKLDASFAITATETASHRAGRGPGDGGPTDTDDDAETSDSSPDSSGSTS